MTWSKARKLAVNHLGRHVNICSFCPSTTTISTEYFTWQAICYSRLRISSNYMYRSCKKNWSLLYTSQLKEGVCTETTSIPDTEEKSHNFCISICNKKQNNPGLVCGFYILYNCWSKFLVICQSLQFRNLPVAWTTASVFGCKHFMTNKLISTLHKCPTSVAAASE